MKYMMLNFFLWSLLAIANEVTSTNIFISNTNFWNKDNWNNKQLPCPVSDIHFTKSAPSVFMDSLDNLPVHEMVLPYHSELILGNGFNLFPSPSNSRYNNNCHSLNALYTKSKPDYWFDPKNWCVQEKVSDKCGSNNLNGIEASLIPTENDFVVLPKNAMYYISQKANEPTIKAGIVRYHGKSFLNTYSLRKEFKSIQRLMRPEFFNSRTMGFPNIRMKRYRCSLCVKNGNLNIMPTICAYVKCKSKPKDCLYYVKPLGSCCSLCNVKSYNLQFFDKTLSLRSVNKRIMTLSSNHEGFKELSFNFLVIDPTKVQFTIGVKSGNSKEFRAIIPLIDELLMKNKHDWGIVKIEGLEPVQNSGFKWKILIPILILIILMSGLIYYFIIKRNHGLLPISALNLDQFHIPRITIPSISINLFRNPFNRSRFYDDSEEIGTYNVATGEFIELPETTRTTEVSFDNPMFDKEGMQKYESKQ